MSEQGVEPIEEAKRAFAGAIRGELTSLEGALRSLFVRFDLVARHGRGVNGLAAAAKAWRREAELLAEKIREESEDVNKALLGEGEPITEHVDLEQRERVQRAKDAT